MTIHSMNVYLDDVAFEELRIIEQKIYKDEKNTARNRSDIFKKIIHEYISKENGTSR